MKKLHNYLTIACLFFLIVSRVAAECTCEAEDEQRDKAGARKYQIASIPSIIVAGAIGVMFPVVGRSLPSLRPESTLFFVIKAFAAGVILSTGFIHVLPEAFEMLTSPCLKNAVWENFPFTGFIAMMTAIITLSIDSFASSYYRKVHFRKGEGEGGDKEADNDHAGHVHVHTHATHGHAHGHFHGDPEAASLSETLRYRVIAQVLELGIIVHSVVIGISLGASQSPDTAKALFAALMFHQCFEGMGLGSCITQAKFNWRDTTVMALFFSFTTPVGVGVGLGISNTYDESSPTALIVQGALNAASAGILIYMSLVDFLANDFMNPKMQSNIKLQVVSHLALLLGAGVMSVLAKWA